LDRLAKAKTDQDRFYALNEAAKQSFVTGKIEDARSYSTELLALLPQFPKDWNYGHAVHDANLVLGRIAVREGRLEEAKSYLLEAGMSPGGPGLNSFGPNMSLASDLIEKGERAVVLEYFERCRRFWRNHGKTLDRWSQSVKTGSMPNFGPNLFY
jgi:hypothetical protein